MGLEEVNRIKEFFAKERFDVEYLEHAPAITSEDASKQRGFQLKQGIKSILLTDGKDFVIVNVAADKKLDSKKVAEFSGWSKSRIRFATGEEVLMKTGCERGAVPPFYHKENIKILVDKGVYDNEFSGFNIGVRTQSVKIKTEYMKRVFEKIGAIEGIFAQV